MDKIAVELKLAESKTDNLRKKFEDINSQSNSIISLTVQWRDLEDHFDSVQKLIVQGFVDLRSRERHMDSIHEELKSKEQRLEERMLEINSQKEGLDLIWNSIDERLEKVELKEKDLEARAQAIELREKELELEKQVVEESHKEVNLKEAEVESFRKSVVELSEAEEQRLDFVRKSVDKCSQEIEKKVKRLDSIKKQIDERCKDVRLKENRLRLTKEYVEERCKELKSKDKQFDLMKQSIDKLSDELELKERQLNSMNRVCTQVPGLKEKQLAPSQKVAVPSKPRSKRKRPITPKRTKTRLISWLHTDYPQNQTLQKTSSDPLLQQAYSLADIELFAPIKDDSDNEQEPTKKLKEEEVEKEIVMGGSVSSEDSNGKPRRCTHCLAERTPEWRKGPLGSKTLCNACGLRYSLGKLVPESKPANSSTLVSEVDSSSPDN